MGKKKDIFAIRPFEKLRKTIERQAAAVTAPPARKKKEEYTDEELFTSAMDDVQEIEAFRQLSCERLSRVRPEVRRDIHIESLAILTDIAQGLRPIHLPDTQEYIAWTNPDYASELTVQLHEGRFSVQAFLDLHGCTVPEAIAELDDFLRDAFRKRLRCVKIIHGRGLRSMKGPQIKEAVARRLAGRYQKGVIAYASARQCDGGLGALYVLLA